MSDRFLVALLILQFALVMIFPLYLLWDTAKNPALSSRARLSWLLGGVLLYPFAPFLYGVTQASSRRTRVFSVAVVLLCLMIAWPLLNAMMRDTGEIDRLERIESLQESAASLPDTREREALRRDLSVTRKYTQMRRMLGGLAANADETMKEEVRTRDEYEALCLEKLSALLSNQALTSEEYAQWHRCWKTTLPARFEAAGSLE